MVQTIFQEVNNILDDDRIKLFGLEEGLVLIDQIAPFNLTEVTVDGLYSVFNTPADLATFGITGHVPGDILQRFDSGVGWKFVLRPIIGKTFATIKGERRLRVFSDMIGSVPFFFPSLNPAEPFDVFGSNIGTDLPGTVIFSNNELAYTRAGGLLQSDMNNLPFLLPGAQQLYWIEDTAFPERSGGYNLVDNDTGAGTYLFRRDPRFINDEDFTDARQFGISSSGGDISGNNYLMKITETFNLNTDPIIVVQGTLSDIAVAAKVVTEEFANTNARFFGELGLPNLQPGWVQSGTGIISLVSDNVFGITKDVVKNFSTTGNSTKSETPISAADWVNVLTFGASFSGVTRVTEDDILVNALFAGMGFSAGNDPRPSSIRSRVGVFIFVDATHTKVTLDGQAAIVLDGTGGKPLVLKDEWFSWDAFIKETPDAGVNFGDVDFFVNGVLVVTGGIVASNSAVDDEISIANSSSSGQSTFYVDNFGATILEELTTKTISVESMAFDVIQIITPPIFRDFEVVIPDGIGRKNGNVIIPILNNIGGKFKIRTENLGAPKSLINGLNEIEKDVLVIHQITLTNTIENGNVYVGDFLTSHINDDGSIDLKPISGVIHKEGRLYYDAEDHTINLKTNITGSTLSLGKEFWVDVVNKTGATIPDGKVVYINGFDVASGLPTIALAKADVVATSNPIGIATSTMLDDAVGIVTTMGLLNDLDTSSFAAGTQIFLSATSAGDFTATKPSLVVSLGFITKSDAATGQILATFSRSTTDSAIFAQLSSSIDQEPSGTNPVVIIFNTQDYIQGIGHSVTVNPGEITINIGGTYFILAQPQVGKDSGGTAQTFDMFAQSDRGGGFSNEPNSNVKLTVKDAGDDDVIVAGATVPLAAGNKIRFLQRVSNSGVGMGLKFTPGEAGPPQVPATPSIIFTIFRAGGEL